MFKNNIQKLKSFWGLLQKEFIVPFGLVTFGVTSALYIFSLINEDFIYPVWILILGLFLGCLSFLKWFSELDKKNKIKIYITEFSRIIFLVGLISITILNLNSITKEFNLKLILELILIIITITSGFITFCMNNETTEVEIKKEEDDEKNIEAKRKEEFSQKFSKINNIPLIKTIARWTYVQGWFYVISIFFLIITAFIIRIYHLGRLGLWWDEILTGTYVKRIQETGIPISPSDFEYYWRGLPYHYVVTLFTSLLENNEFWLRLPSVFFGVGIIIVVFFIIKRFDKILALSTVFILCFSTYNIEYSRFARFYGMNVFLLLLNVHFFWLGFFENKKKYKILSIILFIVMLTNVQLGAIFMSVVVYWVFYNFYLVYIKKTNFTQLINIKFLGVLFIFISIYFINNPLDLIGNYINQPYIITSAIQTEGNINYLFPGIPVMSFKNVVIPFYNQYYWPSIFSILGYLYIAYVIFKKIKKKESLGYREYIFSVFFISLALFEFTNPFSNEPRLYFIFEPMYVVSSLFFFQLLIKKIIPIKRRSIALFAIAFLLLFSPKPFFWQRINIQYGDSVSNDPFRTTWAQSYRSDSKTTAEYVKKYIAEDDLLINTMEPAYFYIQKNPNYIINQNYKWRNMWRDEIFADDEGNYIDIRYNGILINKVEDLNKIIKANKSKDIWVIVNGQNIKTLYTTHLKNDFNDFVDENKTNTVFVSEDNISRVLLFKKD